MARNPDWSRDELILALDLYMRRRSKLPSESDPEITGLSELLRKLAGPSLKEFTNFRSPDAVAMKLGNIQSIDPQYRAAGLKGLPRGARGDASVWAEFANRPAVLKAAAEAIRKAADAGETLTGLYGDDEDDDADAPEGRLLTRMHRRRERDGKLPRRKKAQVLKRTGKLACEGCGFEFKAYGPRGETFAEVHHKRAVQDLRPGDRTKLSDLAILCANCHRMVHVKRPWLSLEELARIAPRRHG